MATTYENPFYVPRTGTGDGGTFTPDEFKKVSDLYRTMSPKQMTAYNSLEAQTFANAVRQNNPFGGIDYTLTDPNEQRQKSVAEKFYQSLYGQAPSYADTTVNNALAESNNARSSLLSSISGRPTNVASAQRGYSNALALDAQKANQQRELMRDEEMRNKEMLLSAISNQMRQQGSAMEEMKGRLAQEYQGMGIRSDLSRMGIESGAVLDNIKDDIAKADRKAEFWNNLIASGASMLSAGMGSNASQGNNSARSGGVNYGGGAGGARNGGY